MSAWTQEETSETVSCKMLLTNCNCPQPRACGLEISLGPCWLYCWKKQVSVSLGLRVLINYKQIQLLEGCIPVAPFFIKKI